MMQRIGKYTLKLGTPPSIVNFAAIASKKEAEGPMAKYIDILNNDSMFGQQTWEKAESRMQQEVAEKALDKAGLTPDKIGYLFAGDLLNQCIGSNYGLAEIGIPFFGVYSACATMAEGLALSAILVDAGACAHAMAVTSSHFCSAERQYRFPLEYGGQRTPTSQWTVTGAGALILGKGESPPFVKAVTVGTVADKGIKDTNNMGAAMAPAIAIIGPYGLAACWCGIYTISKLHKRPKNSVKEAFTLLTKKLEGIGFAFTCFATRFFFIIIYAADWRQNGVLYGNCYCNCKSKGRGRKDNDLRESWHRTCASRQKGSAD